MIFLVFCLPPSLLPFLSHTLFRSVLLLLLNPFIRSCGTWRLSLIAMVLDKTSFQLPSELRLSHFFYQISLDCALTLFRLGNTRSHEGGRCTMVENTQESRRAYLATHSSIRSFTHTAQPFVYSALPHCSAAFIHLLAGSLSHS